MIYIHNYWNLGRSIMVHDWIIDDFGNVIHFLQDDGASSEAWIAACRFLDEAELGVH